VVIGGLVAAVTDHHRTDADRGQDGCRVRLWTAPRGGRRRRAQLLPGGLLGPAGWSAEAVTPVGR
ncbi:hypothetical protein KBX08_33170, partial [Micromonospora sp. H61]|uniref:hypothetical protein n=1 Tax=Micromonospora sp. H61 TaxID=2824888 RepID=UPI001B395C6B